MKIALLKQIIFISSMLLIANPSIAQEAETTDSIVSEQSFVKNILFFGDSMTGWMAERLQAYGAENGFSVSTIVWDGSTISKWAKSGKLKSYISKYNPDAVFISLGLNEMLTKNPESTLRTPFSKIMQTIGNIPYVWVGPPSWPGKGDGKIFNDWLKENLDSNSFFKSNQLVLPRQSKQNPHPSKSGIIQLMDSVLRWIPNSNLQFKSLNVPENKQMIRGKNYIYKRLNESL